MKRCKHLHREERNRYIEDYHCVECDVYCSDCGQYLGYWAYGYSDVEENIYFEKWYNRLFYSIKTKIHNFKICGIKKHDNDDLPF